MIDVDEANGNKQGIKGGRGFDVPSDLGPKQLSQKTLTPAIMYRHHVSYLPGG